MHAPVANVRTDMIVAYLPSGVDDAVAMKKTAQSR